MTPADERPPVAAVRFGSVFAPLPPELAKARTAKAEAHYCVNGGTYVARRVSWTPEVWVQTNTATMFRRKLRVGRLFVAGTDRPFDDTPLRGFVSVSHSKRLWTTVFPKRVVPAPLLGFWRWFGARRPQVVECLVSLPRDAGSRVWVFHGTGSAANAKKILDEGFHEGLARPTARHGKGVYLASSPQVARRHGAYIVVGLLKAAFSQAGEQKPGCLAYAYEGGDAVVLPHSLAENRLARVAVIRVLP